MEKRKREKKGVRGKMLQLPGTFESGRLRERRLPIWEGRGC